MVFGFLFVSFYSLSIHNRGEFRMVHVLIELENYPLDVLLAMMSMMP